MIKAALVTTGATETFNRLIDFSMSDVFLEYLVANNFTRLIIQYGTNPSIVRDRVRSSRDFTAVLQPLETLDMNRNSKVAVPNGKNNAETIWYKHRRLRIDTYAFNNDLTADLESLSLVISHSGTGSILDSLRLHKPLLVVVNDKLMDNHQLEIASVLEQMDLLLYYRFSSECSTEQNYRRITKCLENLMEKQATFNRLEPPNTTALNNVVCQELGWV